jgi:predicted nuclease of predicted toxin-antitoxin system
MRLLVDMNLTPRWVEFLARQGWETAHWSSVGDARASDRQIMDWTRERGFVLVTSDLDFPHMLAQTNSGGPSVVLLRGEPLIPEVRGEALSRLCREELAPGAIAVLDLRDTSSSRVVPLT